MATSARPRPTEREVAKQTGVLRAAGVKGRRLLHDIDVYVQGINAKLRAEDSDNAPWTRNDVYALNALKGQFLGQGGGDEVRRSQLLASLTQRLGTTRGFSVFDDLRQRDPAGHPATIEGRFPYAQVPAQPGGQRARRPGVAGARRLRPASLGRHGGRGRRSGRPAAASNILILDGERSQTGRPLFVGGPQIGYFYPGLTLEMDLHGPGVDTRGVTSAPFPGYMLIGRGPDFAWTLTSAGADNIDQYVEELCEGSDIRYRYKGRCRSMSTFVAGTIAAHGDAARAARRLPPHQARAGHRLREGRRPARGDLPEARELRARHARPAPVPGPDARQGATAPARSCARSCSRRRRSTPSTPTTATSRWSPRAGCRCAPRDVDPGLPTRGDGEHEWRGWLSDAEHPQQINPRSGTLINWNNKTARGFEAGRRRLELRLDPPRRPAHHRAGQAPPARPGLGDRAR